MVSILRSMWSRRLSAEFVDGSATLHFGEAFKGGHIELDLDLVGGDAVLLCEVEKKLDLFRAGRSIRCRAVSLAVVFLGRSRSHLLTV